MRSGHQSGGNSQACGSRRPGERDQPPVSLPQSGPYMASDLRQRVHDGPRQRAGLRACVVGCPRAQSGARSGGWHPFHPSPAARGPRSARPPPLAMTPECAARTAPGCAGRDHRPYPRYGGEPSRSPAVRITTTCPQVAHYALQDRLAHDQRANSPVNTVQTFRQGRKSSSLGTPPYAHESSSRPTAGSCQAAAASKCCQAAVPS